MDKKALAFLLIGMIALLGGFAYSYFTPELNLFSELPFTVAIIFFFLAGALFFGFFSFVPALLFGLEMGAERNAAIFLYLVPCALAIYAGTSLGASLFDDFFKKKHFLSDGKKIILILCIALILALVIELAIPRIIDFWPKDFAGMNLIQGKSSVGALGDLSKFLGK